MRFRGQLQLLIPLASGCCLVRAATTEQTTTTSSASTTTTTSVPEFSFSAGDWSACSSPCDRGTRGREVKCVRTCSLGLYCPKVDESKCEDARPSSSEVCYGPSFPCPVTTSITFTSTSTSTRTLTSTTVVPPTTTRGALDGWECASGGDAANCLPEVYAELRCGPRCRCCMEAVEPTEAPVVIPFATVAPVVEDAADPAAGDSDDATLQTIVIASTSVVVLLAIVLGLLWWRSCIHRAEKARQNRDKQESLKAKTTGLSASEPGANQRNSFPKSKTAPEGTIFDRKLGEGLPSAPPDGYFEDPPDWTLGPENGMRSKSSRDGRKKLFTASSEYYWSPDQPASAPSSPSRARRSSAQPDHRANKSEDSDECLTPPESPSKKSSSPRGSPSGTLPPGYAAAARAARRAGKEAPNLGSFGGEPPPMPGQANTESGVPPKGSPTRGMATPPRANEEGGLGGTSRPKHASTSSGFHRSATADSPRHKESPRASGAGAESGESKGPSSKAAGAGSASGSAGAGASSSGGGAGADGSNHDPRVARETAASAEASDLIAKVDLELDQTMGKDLETRRRTFKNLMLTWHPDKNQRESLATEVFRHLMARRGRYLEA